MDERMVRNRIDRYMQSGDAVLGKKAEIEENNRIMETPRKINPFHAVRGAIARRRARGLEPELNEELKQLEGDRERDALDLLYRVSVIEDSNPLWYGGKRFANESDALIRLVEQSLRTDPDLRESIRSNTGDTSVYWSAFCRLEKEGKLPQKTFPPADWARRRSVDSYRRGQVQEIRGDVTLLRTLVVPQDIPDRLEFTEGDVITMGPGLSTTVTSPHWLGGSGVLLIIRGVTRGVPMVGKWGSIDINENEVFIPDRIRCKVTEAKHNETVEYTKKKSFWRIYSLQVIEAAKPSTE